MAKFVKAIVACMMFFGTSHAQTHLTSNDEKCWIIKSISDPTGTSYVVVVQQDTADNAKIQRILKSANAETTLVNEGFRVEIFRARELTKYRKMSQDFFLQQRIKKRSSDISYNRSLIEKMEKDMSKTTSNAQKKLLSLRIKRLKEDNETMERKNRNFQW
jgi:hypothetical protein